MNEKEKTAVVNDLLLLSEIDVNSSKFKSVRKQVNQQITENLMNNPDIQEVLRMLAKV